MKPTEFFVWATVYMLSVFSIFLFLIGVYWRSVFERLAAHRHRSWSWWSAFELFLKHEVQTWISRLLVIQVCCLNVINKFRIFHATVWKYLFPGRPCGRAIWWHDDPGDVWAPGAPSLLKVFLASVFALWFSFARCRKTNRIYAQSDPWGFPGQQMEIACSGHSCPRSSNQAIFFPILFRAKRPCWRYVSAVATFLATSLVQENHTLLSRSR